MRRLALLAILPLLALAAEGTAAYAYWQAHGTGSGTANAQSMSAATALGNVTGLLPGADSDVALTVRNPNPFSVSIVDVTMPGPILVDEDHAGCEAHVTFVFDPALHDLPPLAANDQAAAVTLGGAVHFADTAPPECHGALFTLPVRLTVRP